MSNCCDESECVITLPGCWVKGSALTGQQLRPIEHQFTDRRQPIQWITALAATGTCCIVREDNPETVVLADLDAQTVNLYDTGWAELEFTSVLLNACEPGWYVARFHCVSADGQHFWSPHLRFLVKADIV